MGSLLNLIIKNKKNMFIFIIILTLFSSIPIFILGSVPYGHDLNFHLSRIQGLSDNIKNLDFFNGVYKEYYNGYGYANGLFYPDIFLYLPALLRAFGMKITVSYKIFIIFINFFSILSMYLTVKGISKNKNAAVLASLIYAFVPYRLVDLYERAALGEALAFIFVPLVFYGIYEIIFGDYKKFWVLTIGMTGLILSHILSTYMVGIVLLIICLINIKRFVREKERVLYLLIAALITLFLTSYFLFPMIEQMMSQTFKYSSTGALDQFKLSNRVVNPLLLFLEIPHIYKLLNLEYWVPSGIGIMFIYLIYILLLNRKKNDSFTNQALVISVFTLVIVCIKPFWELGIVERTLYLVQFPWRFYMFPTILLTICGSICMCKNGLSLKKFTITLMLSMVSLGSMFYLMVRAYKVKYLDEYSAAFNEYLPAEVTKNYILNNPNRINSNNSVDTNIIDKGSYKIIEFNLKEENDNDTYLELPLVYYKGYMASCDGNDLKVYKSDKGLVTINIESRKEGSVKVRYSGTIVQIFTRFISLISAIIFSIYIYKEVKHEK